MIRDPDDEFPFASGRYTVAAGLRPLNRPVFRFSDHFERYRNNKLAARSERLSKYFQIDRFEPELRRRVQRFIIDRLIRECPDQFSMDGTTLNCHLTGDRLRFSVDGSFTPDNHFKDGFDALAMQLEEDVAVMRRIGDSDFACAIHLCAPNHWSAEEKIGKSFVQMHLPVADIEPINRNAKTFLDLMIRSEGGLSRDAWGIATSDEFNRHPEPPPNSSPARSFDFAEPRAFVRVESQTMVGFPDLDGLLFVIRTRFIDCNSLDRERRGQLIAAVESMSDDVLKYKGLDSFAGSLVEWLRGERPCGTAATRGSEMG